VLNVNSFQFSDLSELKQQQHVNANNTVNSLGASATAAAMLANGYSAAFPFLQHFSAGSTPTSQQQQQLVAAAAALGLPGLPPRYDHFHLACHSSESHSLGNHICVHLKQ
jgi:hypothetical protein